MQSVICMYRRLRSAPYADCNLHVCCRNSFFPFLAFFPYAEYTFGSLKEKV